MAAMKEVSFNAETMTSSIGSGSRWYDVYSTLDMSNVSVVGGREPKLGVAGLILGGS